MTVDLCGPHRVGHACYMDASHETRLTQDIPLVYIIICKSIILMRTKGFKRPSKAIYTLDTLQLFICHLVLLVKVHFFSHRVNPCSWAISIDPQTDSYGCQSLPIIFPPLVTI